MPEFAGATDVSGHAATDGGTFGIGDINGERLMMLGQFTLQVGDGHPCLHGDGHIFVGIVNQLGDAAGADRICQAR